jgi:hypothetical protein
MIEAHYYRRLLIWQALLTIAGLAGWMLARGSVFALSFLTGAIASGFSFWLLHRITLAVSGAKVSAWSMVTGALRLLLIGVALSAILTAYQLQAGAAASGILIVVGSILIETVRELLLKNTRNAS